MPRKSKSTLQKILNRLPNVFGRSELENQLASEPSPDGSVPVAAHFIQDAITGKHLQQLRFEFPNRNFLRYVQGPVRLFELVQSLKPESYFTHYTAIQLHQLTEQIPKTVYLNFEQKLKAGGGTLTQGGIDRAFKGKCRVSNFVATYDDFRIIILNGANTGQLGVIDMPLNDGSTVRVTNIERTLIDATVRPVYSGGIFEVAKAFKLAHGKVSIEALVANLKQLNFTYPYHQAIGYYLERAGEYSPKEIDQLKDFPMNFDFYLDYGIKRPEYNARWRLHIPKGF